MSGRGSSRPICSHWQPAEPFDAIYDQTCLCALPPEIWPDYAARLHGWLRPGGRLFVLFMQTGSRGGPPFHCDLTEMQRLFAPTHWDLAGAADLPGGALARPNRATGRAACA